MSGAAGPQALAPALPRRRRHGRGFTITVSVLSALGAVLMAWVLFHAGAPDAVVVGTLLAAIPVLPVVACFWWLDRYEPEPPGLLLLGIGWGAFVATAIALLLQAADQVVFDRPQTLSGAVTAPVTEEAAKGLFIVLLLLWRRHELDGVLDGIVYAGMVGVGFAFTENILYLASAYMGEGIPGQQGPGGLGASVLLFIVRGVFSPFAHPVFTAMTGIGVGYAVVTRRWWVRVVAPAAGYLGAVVTHALWNGTLLLGGGGVFVAVYFFLMVPAFVGLVLLAVWVRRREALMLHRSLADCAQRGFLHPTEVPWLASLPARRLARRHARSVGGRAAGKVMREYQQTATELGYLHHRYLRGTAPEDVVPRGQLMVDRLVWLRPGIVWPPVTGPAPPLAWQPR